MRFCSATVGPVHAPPIGRCHSPPAPPLPPPTQSWVVAGLGGAVWGGAM